MYFYKIYFQSEQHEIYSPPALSVLCYRSWRRVLSVKALLMTKVISTPGEGYSHQGCLRKMKTCELSPATPQLPRMKRK